MGKRKLIDEDHAARLAELQRREWRERRAVYRQRRDASGPKQTPDKATAAAQGRLVRQDWTPEKSLGLALRGPPRRPAKSSSSSASTAGEGVLAQCRPEQFAAFLAWLRGAPGHVRAMETHPSSTMLAAKLHLIRRAP